MDILTVDQIKNLSPEDQKEYLSILKRYKELRKYSKINFFKPYAFQKKLFDLGSTERVRGAVMANRVGKTYSICIEAAYHLTGLYPEWWEGRRWNRPIKAVAAGVTSGQIRDVLQKEFIGTPNRNLTSELGTGTIPKDKLLLDISAKARDGAYSEVYIKHVSGESSHLKFFAYSQGFEPMQGFTADLAIIDEQCPDDVFSELVKRTSTVDGSTILSFTPLQGLTHSVNQFWDPSGPFHGGMVNAGWDDVEHLTEEAKEQMLAATPTHLRDAVCKGIPVLGSGAVFNIPEEDIVYDDIEIKSEWPRLAGIDVGFTNDPTAGIFVAEDPSTHIYYIYDEYGNIDNNTWSASQHIGPLHQMDCSRIPIIYDTAAKAKVGAAGTSITELWMESGLNVLPEPFKNPTFITDGKKYSHNAIAPGLSRMFELMTQGKLKVHRKCTNFWREFRKYSYDDKGVPSQKDNHWIDASRMAVMSMEKGLGRVPGVSWYSGDNYYDNYQFQSWS